MPFQFETDDGNPWYVSHGIWVVPGDDPNGRPGRATVDQPSCNSEALADQLRHWGF